MLSVNSRVQSPRGECATGSLGWRLRLLFVGLIVARGLIDLCIIPPFEGWDEYQHVGYIEHILETGKPAIFGKTDMPTAVLAAVPAFPQCKCALEHLDSRLGALQLCDLLVSKRWRCADCAGCDPVAAGVQLKLYEAQHSWWYYRLVVPLFEPWAACRTCEVRSGDCAY